MAFDLGSAVNSVTSWFTTSKLVAAIVGNPLIIAAVIAVLAIMIAAATLGCHTEMRHSIRAAVNVTLAALAVLFIHDAVLTARLRSEIEHDEMGRNVRQIQSTVSPKAYPVPPEVGQSPAPAETLPVPPVVVAPRVEPPPIAAPVTGSGTRGLPPVDFSLRPQGLTP